MMPRRQGTRRLPLAPPFLINFEMQGKLRFLLEVSVEVMGSEPRLLKPCADLSHAAPAQ